MSARLTSSPRACGSVVLDAAIVAGVFTRGLY
jgi:hypothetical protein